MHPTLPRLRSDLDVMPSPLPERPGLIMRDPYRYSDSVLVVPPLLAQCLGCFDGRHSATALRERLARLTGNATRGFRADALAETLSASGFLEDATFAAMKSNRERLFAEATVRPAIHAGGGYPGEPEALADAVTTWLHGDGAQGGGQGEGEDLVAIAAPHVSPSGGKPVYGAAYRALRPVHAQRTFVILGTSHYGAPGRLGLTRKPFRTPFGDATTDTDLVEELMRSAGAVAHVEDYCHAVEHSIEFQVLFLQHLFGPSVNVVPVLCGPFSRTGHGGPGGPARPEDDPAARRTLDALAALHARHGRRLLWVLGVDLAHIGRRYGDSISARADQGPLRKVAERDRARLDLIAAGDADGFWDLTHQAGDDDLRWCGAAPLYAFLRAVPRARGVVSGYAQWNIDDASVVSFAAMSFSGR